MVLTSWNFIIVWVYDKWSSQFRRSHLVAEHLIEDNLVVDQNPHESGFAPAPPIPTIGRLAPTPKRKYPQKPN